MQCAVEMGDTKLIVKLSEDDMISRNGCYHHKCMTGFTNSYRSFVNDRNKNGKDKQKRRDAIVIFEVSNYMEETLEASAVISPYLKLSDVKAYYCQVLEHLNAEFVSVNSTRLKERLLQLNTNLEEMPYKKEIFISFRDDLVAATKFSK